jgi:uncharacterized membrane protein YkvA (DUF1232 family)
MAKFPNKLLNVGFLSRIFQDLKLLFFLIRDYWKGVYRDVSIWSILVFAIAIIYILSPIDIIPDFNLGIGQIDDAVVLFLCLNFLEKDLYKYKDWKIRNEM